MVKSLPASAGDMGSIPGSGRCPGEGNDYPLQYSCQENPMDRGAWRAIVQRAAKSQTGLSIAQLGVLLLAKFLPSFLLYFAAIDAYSMSGPVLVLRKQTGHHSSSRRSPLVRLSPS